MPGLYNITSNANITVGDTIGLYQQSGGNVYILNNAQQLLNTLSQNGNVNFGLDPASSNTRVLAYTANIGTTAGTYGSSIATPIITVGADGRVTNVTTANITVGGNYGNANVAAFLPHYGGTINTTSAFSNAGIALQGTTWSQLQWTNGAAVPADQTNIGTGSWFYLDSNGAVFESNSTGTVHTITLTNSGNVQAGNVITTANVQAAYFKGDGSKLTNLPVQTGTYSNTNVAAYLTTATIATTGNVSAGNLISNNFLYPNGVSILTGIGGTYSNANVAAYLASNTDPTISSLTANAAVQAVQIDLLNANVTAANVNIQTIDANLGAFETYANATFTTYSNANVAAYLLTNTGDIQAGNVTVQGTLLSDDITASNVLVDGDTTITGNLLVLGNTTTFNSNTITTNDKNITVANNISIAAFLDGAGLDAGNTAIATWRYNFATSSWQSNIAITPASNAISNLGGTANRWNDVYAVKLYGDGSSLTNLPVQTGTYSNTNVAAYLASNTDPTISNLTANAAVQAVQINTINANLGAYQTYANANIGTLFLGNISTNANLGAFQTYANATFITTAGAYGNANVAAYLPIYSGVMNNLTGLTVDAGGNEIHLKSKDEVQLSSEVATGYWANITIRGASGNIDLTLNNTPGQPKPSINLESNVWVTGNTRTSGFFLGNGSLLTGIIGSYGNANVAAYLAANTDPTISTLNANAATQATSINTINANIGAYQTYANANIGTLFNGNITTNANLGAFQTYANANFITTGGTYGNSNVASYLASNSAVTITTTANISTVGNVTAGNIFIPQTIGTGYPNNWLLLGSTPDNAKGGFGLDIDGTTTNFGSLGGNVLISANGGAYEWLFNSAGNLVLPGNVGQTYITYLNGNVYGGSGGGSQTPWTSNIAGAGFYLSNAILETTRQKTVTLGNLTGTVSINANLGPIQSGTLTGNITLNTNNFTNLNAGQTVTLILTQDATGSRLLTSNLKYAANNRALSTAANSIDSMSVLYDGTNYLASLVKGYA